MPIISRNMAEILLAAIDGLTKGAGVTSPDDMVNIDDVETVVMNFVDDNVKVQAHHEVVERLTALYRAKNHDYGDSFGRGFRKYGLIMPVIRLEDKLNRLTSLVTGKEQRVHDESIRDTLMDLANYAVMTLVEMDLEEQREET